MNAATLIALAAQLVQTVLTEAKAPGSTVAVEVITELEAALAALFKVHGTDVTVGQLESLRTKTTW